MSLRLSKGAVAKLPT